MGLSSTFDILGLFWPHEPLNMAYTASGLTCCRLRKVLHYKFSLFSCSMQTGDANLWYQIKPIVHTGIIWRRFGAKRAGNKLFAGHGFIVLSLCKCIEIHPNERSGLRNSDAVWGGANGARLLLQLSNAETRHTTVGDSAVGLCFGFVRLT